MDNNEFVEVVSAGMDALIEKQSQLEKMWNRYPARNSESTSVYIREVILSLMSEIQELLQEVHWKPWKSSRGLKNIDSYREELADVLHFTLDLYIAAGLTGKDAAQDYLDKWIKNTDRVSDTDYRES